MPRVARVPKDKKVLVWLDGNSYTKIIREARQARRSVPDQIRFIIDKYYSEVTASQ